MSNKNFDYTIRTEQAFEAVREVIGGLLEAGMLRHPTSGNAVSHVLDVVDAEYPTLGSGCSMLTEILRDNPDQGWTEEQIVWLGTGFDMALMVMHGLDHLGDEPGSDEEA